MLLPVSSWRFTSALFVLNITNVLFCISFWFWDRCQYNINCFKIYDNFLWFDLQCHALVNSFSHWKHIFFNFSSGYTPENVLATVACIQCSIFFSRFARNICTCTIFLPSIFSGSWFNLEFFGIFRPLSVTLILDFSHVLLECQNEFLHLFSKLTFPQKLNI